jgi:hypothetical protein
MGRACGNRRSIGSSNRLGFHDLAPLRIAAPELWLPQLTPEQTRDVMASSKKLLKQLPTDDAMRETLLGLLSASDLAAPSAPSYYWGG